MQFVRFCLVALVIGSLTACAVSSGPPTAAALAEGAQRDRKVLSEMQRRGMIIDDPSLNGYMRQIVARVSQTRPPGLPPVTPYIVKDADINAFTLGGNAIFINAGLIAAMENEAQLAMVIAHEIGHIDRGHVTGRQQTGTGIQILGAIAAIGLGAAGVDPNITQVGVGLGANAAMSSYTRDQERDADAIGAQYLLAGGYSVQEGARSFEVLRRVYGERGGPAAIIFSSHPMSSERQATLTQLCSSASRAGGSNCRTRLPATARNKPAQARYWTYLERNGSAVRSSATPAQHRAAADRSALAAHRDQKPRIEERVAKPPMKPGPSRLSSFSELVPKW